MLAILILSRWICQTRRTVHAADTLLHRAKPSSGSGGCDCVKSSICPLLRRFQTLSSSKFREPLISCLHPPTTVGATRAQLRWILTCGLPGRRLPLLRLHRQHQHRLLLHIPTLAMARLWPSRPGQHPYLAREAMVLQKTWIRSCKPIWRPRWPCSEARPTMAHTKLQLAPNNSHDVGFRLPDSTAVAGFTGIFYSSGALTHATCAVSRPTHTPTCSVAHAERSGRVELVSRVVSFVLPKAIAMTTKLAAVQSSSATYATDLVPLDSPPVQTTERDMRIV